MKGIPSRSRGAQFRTVISFIDGERELWTEGIIKGEIGEMPVGNSGFGYDPIFFIPELNKTFAELSTEEKNKISHRGLAMKKLCILLKEYLSV